jgi:hypothetical protein
VKTALIISVTLNVLFVGWTCYKFIRDFPSLSGP